MTLLTKQEIEALLEGTTPGPWRADGPPYNRIVWSSADNRVCFMAHSNGLNDERDIATSNLAAAAPDLARAALDALARVATLEKVGRIREAEWATFRDALISNRDRLAAQLAEALLRYADLAALEARHAALEEAP